VGGVISRALATEERPAWQERPKPHIQAAKSVSVLIILALVLIPLYSVALTSLSTQASINTAGGLVLWPHGLTVNAYSLIFGGGVVARALIISLVVTAAGTAFSMLVTILAAYGLSRAGSFGHRTILWIMLLTMFFNGGVIPLFLVVSALGGYDQYWALIVPSAVSVFNIIVMRSFFANIASDLIESARIDGAGDWKILWRIVLPTSKAVTAVIALFYAVGYWNSWFNILLFMPADSAKWPLQMVMYNYVTQGMSMAGSGITNIGQNLGRQQIAPLSLQMAVVVLTVVPILIVYPFVQRHFTKGVLLGAIKGLSGAGGRRCRRCRHPGRTRHTRCGRRVSEPAAGPLLLEKRARRGGRLRRRAGVQPGAARPGLRAHRHRRRLPVGRRRAALDPAAGFHRVQRLERARRGIHRPRPG
jgi:putative aldouronate transport system permease protein